MDLTALFNITYGLYLLTAREEDRDNGCIINTAIQAASDPARITVCCIKGNHTCGMIERTGHFNVSAITVGADFELFRRFGMQSGREVDKFDGFEAVRRSENGLYYLAENASMYLSARVTDKMDLGSHMLYVGELTAAENIASGTPCTYAYYQSDIKPRPEKAETPRWVCSICGFVYEGANLPADYVCPICKHGSEYFKKA